MQKQKSQTVIKSGLMQFPAFVPQFDVQSIEISLLESIDEIKKNSDNQTQDN